ncbi:MAG: prolyl oligopeptidase family serine peptidase [candidate division Zixibacteria bacterium]|nr:prolyl oligopeptidase family serine peptidase [candidate division Zixibacteria bacterium]
MISKPKFILTAFLLISVLVVSACIEERADHSNGDVKKAEPGQKLLTGDYIPDIERFMQIGYVSRGAISRDGSRIFCSPSFTNVSQLFRYEKGEWPYQLTSFEDGISWYTLSHDSYHAIVGAAVGGDENAQMYLLDTETGRIEKLTDNPQARYGSVLWTDDDLSIFFASNFENGRDFKIYKMKLPDGDPELIWDKTGWNGPVELSEDGKLLVTYTAHSSRNNDFLLVNLETGEEEVLTPHDGEYLYSSISMMPGFKTAYITTNNTPDGITRVAKLDVDTKEVTFLDPEEKWECEGAGVSEDGRYLFWQLNVDGYAEPYVKDLKNDVMLPLPDLDGMYTFGGVTENGRFLFGFNNANNPPNFWIWDPSTENLEKITDVSTMGIDVSEFIEPELIRYKSFDGLEIPAFLYTPRDFEPGNPIPFIMDIHGGPEGQYRPYFNRHFNYLLAHGFGIIAPNVRGSDGYGKEYLDMDNYKNRLNSVADAAEGVKYLIDNGYTTSEMMGVKGGSYGGYMVMALITEYPDLFAAAWNQVGIVNFVTFLENTAEYRRYLRESEYGPLSDREFLKSISPIHKVDVIKTPLMVVHGENDPRVPVDEARQIIRELEKRGGVVDSLIFPDEGHGVAKLENRLLVYRTMVEFFTEHLKK